MEKWKEKKKEKRCNLILIFKLRVMASSVLNLTKDSASAVATGRSFHCGIVLGKKLYL